jgi:hypothetical protein
MCLATACCSEKATRKSDLHTAPALAGADFRSGNSRGMVLTVLELIEQLISRIGW